MGEQIEKKNIFKRLTDKLSEKPVLLYSLIGAGAVLVIVGILLIVLNSGKKEEVQNNDPAGQVVVDNEKVKEATPTPVPTADPAVVTEVPAEDDEEKIGPSIIPIAELPVAIEKTESKYRAEDYVKTYLLFGIEEIHGASNTDAIVLLSINTKDKTLKFTSLMRDTYVEIPNFYANKINSVYAHGMKIGETAEEKKKNGANLLMDVIGQTYDIDISGYLSVNFKSFENIIDRLGGIDIQLGSREASYLCTTNYISNPAYRNVHSGWNHLNGNQVVGYSRLRKVPNINGTNNDYGRTERHRMVLSAIVEQYKSLSIFEMLSVLSDCLGYVNTDLTADQFAEMIENVVENEIFTIKEMRLPIDGLFSDSGKKGIYNGRYNVTYALTIDKYREKTIKKFHEFVFLDNPEEAAAATE